MEKFEEVLKHLGPDYSIESKGGPIKYLLKNGILIGVYNRYFLKDGAVCGKLGVKIKTIINANGEVMGEGRNQSEREAEKIVLDHLGPAYSIESKKDIKYLIKDGVRIKGGYHGYFLRDGSVCGKLGNKVEVVISVDGKIKLDGGYDRSRRSGREAEKAVLKHLGPDYSIESTGSKKYLLKDDAMIGGCYNGFFLKNGAVYGKLGAKAKVIVSSNGKIVNEDFD